MLVCASVRDRERRVFSSAFTSSSAEGEKKSEMNEEQGYEMDEEEGNRALEATLVALADDVRSGSIAWLEDNKGGIADTWSNRVCMFIEVLGAVPSAFDFGLAADFGSARRFFVRENVACPTERVRRASEAEQRQTLGGVSAVATSLRLRAAP